MGDVFCLVIFQNGNRRKLKLATGTYAEFLEKLSAIADVDFENTLIQMFDTDLDDFVDLVPEDEIPNKAKLRVVSRSASVLCNAALAIGGQNVAHHCPQNLLVSGSDEMQVDDVAISHTSMHDSDGYLKFELPSSFGVWCDNFLQSKRPVTAKVKTHIISVVFKACYRMNPVPTPRLYNQVLDSLAAKYPHVMEGKYNRRRWLMALRSRFKSERENLTVTSADGVKAQETSGLNLSQADADDEHSFVHAQHALANQKAPSNSLANSSSCEDKSIQEKHLSKFTNASARAAEADMAGDSEAPPSDSVGVCLVSDQTEFLEMSEHTEDYEKSTDCPEYSAAVMEDVTVSSLLGMCTNEKASQALMMAQQLSQGSADESESCDEPTEEVRHSKNEQIKGAMGSVSQKNLRVSNGKRKARKTVLKDFMELEEETSEGNVNGVPLNDRAVIGTEGDPAASATAALPGTSQGRSSSTDSSESGKRCESFLFHFESLPEHLQKALKAKGPLPPRDRRALVRCVVEQLMEVCSRPRQDLIREAAVAVVQAFPDALEDRGLDGELLGKGYDSFHQQLKSRADNVALRRPTVSPGTSRGRSSSTYSSKSERQYESFSFRTEYLPEHVREALKVKRPLPIRERREVVRCVVDQLRAVCSRPKWHMLREAAAVVVQAFPDALEERGPDGRPVGTGWDFFFGN
ncbi:hypothetical protein MTO96_048129 [Rhipicephalus appendiculatus]